MARKSYCPRCDAVLLIGKTQRWCTSSGRPCFLCLAEIGALKHNDDAAVVRMGRVHISLAMTRCYVLADPEDWF